METTKVYEIDSSFYVKFKYLKLKWTLLKVFSLLYYSQPKSSCERSLMLLNKSSYEVWTLRDINILKS